MPALTALDVNARQVMLVQAQHLIGRADNPIQLAEEMVEVWRSILREQRGQGVQPLRKQPSGEFRQATAILQEAADNTLTKKVNMQEIMGRIEADEVTKP